MDPSSDMTVTLLRVGLDMAATRQQVIAHNIANANTPDFQPVRVNFDEQIAALRRATERGADLGSATTLTPIFELGTKAVQLDAEVADMSHNSLQYQTLTKLMRRHFDLMGLAVTEGKR